MKWKIVLSGLLFLFTLQMKGQEIRGIVYDAKFDRPLPNVSVLLTDSRHGSVSDKSGNFKISGIKPGNYKLMASMVGYLIYEKEIEVSSGSILNLNVYLQPTNITLNNEIVITARRAASNEFTTPEAISVVNQQIIEEESPRSVPEALTGTTGVFLQKTNHGGGSPIIRGLIGNQNLLMVDGIRLNNATFRSGPNQYLNTIDPNLVDKMEVVRGSGSVLYGTDALGGVVQVITRNPSFADSGFMAGANLYGKMVSENMEKSGRAEVNLASKKIAFLGGYTYHDFGDIVAGDTLGKETPTGYTEYSADGKLLVKLPKNNELTIAYQYDRLNNVPRYDKIVSGYSFYHFDPQIRQLGYLKLKTYHKNKWISQINFTASFNQSDESRKIQKNGQSKIRYEHDKVNTWGGTMEICSYPLEDWKIVSGIDYYYDKVISGAVEVNNGTESIKRGLYPNGSTSASIAVFTSHTFTVQNFSFILGGRFNTFDVKATDEVFGNVDVKPSAVVGNASVVYDLKSHINLIGSVYSAFRAPNISDLSSFGTFNYGIEVPNKDLKPEKSLNTEIGIKAKYDRFSGSLYLFRNYLTDLIGNAKSTWDGLDSIDGEKVYRKENYASAFLKGIEAEAQYKFISWLMAYGNLTYTYGQNEDLKEPLSRIPPLNGKIGLHFQSNPGFWSRVEWLSAAKQDRLSSGDEADSRIPKGGTPGWNILNLSAGYTWKWLHITAGLNNIFNKAYRTHGSGVDGYGRSVWLAMKVGF